MRALTRDERRLLTIVSLPSAALAIALTVVGAYAPVLLEELTGSVALIGLMVGGEGLCALMLPPLIGGWSDRVSTPLGRRIPFLIGATPAAVAALIALATGASVALIAVALLVFYVAYFTYFAPYLALYPDLFPPDTHGRSQSANSVARTAGMGAALVGGAGLLAVWRPLPFLLAAAVLTVTTVILAAALRSRGDAAPAQASPSAAAGDRHAAWRLLRDHEDIRLLTVANCLWELALGAIKTFAVLFVVVGLGRPIASAAVLMALVAAGVVLAAWSAGRLGDRLGHARVLTIGAACYAVGLLFPFLTQSPAVMLPALPVFAFGAGVVSTLAYSMLMARMPADARGAAAGLFGLSRGAGLLAGPVLAGFAIDAAEGWLASTRGYAAMWLVAAVAVGLTVPLVRRLSAGSRTTAQAVG